MNKLSLLSLILLVVIVPTYGQSISSHKGNISIDIFHSFDQNMSGVSMSYKGQNPAWVYENDYNRVNYTIGISSLYYFMNDFALRSGVSYANRNFSNRYYCAVCMTDILPPVRNITLKFVQVPIGIRYYPYNHKIGFFAEIGILNQFLVNKPQINNLKGNSYSLSDIISAGAVYNFSYGFSFQIATKYSNGLSDIFKKADYSYKVFGVQMGLIKKL